MRRGVAIVLVAAACESHPDGSGGANSLLPDIAVEEATHDFGRVNVGETASKLVLVESSGEGVLAIERVVAGDGFDPAFAFECRGGGCEDLLIPPGGHLLIDARFTPDIPGQKGATIEVHVGEHLGGAPPSCRAFPCVERIDLRGEGVIFDWEVAPATLDFGNVVIGTTKTLEVTVVNDSSIPIDVRYEPAINAKLCQGGAADPATFCVSPPRLDTESRFSVASGAFERISVTFEPALPAVERGGFTLEVGAPVSVRFSGTGVVSGFGCEPGHLDFGEVASGACASRAVTCSNTANVPVTIVSWEQTFGSRDFMPVAFSTPVTLAGGESARIDVTYCPSDTGSDMGQLSIETDDPDPRRRFAVVSLAGSAP